MVAAFKVFLVLVVATLMAYCQSAFSAKDVPQTPPRPAVAREARVIRVFDHGRNMFDLSWKQEKGLELVGGQLLEAMANATPGYTPGGALMKQFMKHAGVQLQVGALQATGQISNDPAIAFCQGFLIGL